MNNLTVTIIVKVITRSFSRIKESLNHYCFNLKYILMEVLTHLFTIEMVYTLTETSGPFLHHRTGIYLDQGCWPIFLRHRNGIYLDGDPWSIFTPQNRHFSTQSLNHILTQFYQGSQRNHFRQLNISPKAFLFSYQDLRCLFYISQNVKLFPLRSKIIS